MIERIQNYYFLLDFIKEIRRMKHAFYIVVEFNVVGIANTAFLYVD